jgi:glutaredoxin 2
VSGPEREGATLLFSGDIARLRGITAPHAYKWLVAVEKRYGETVVGRIGNRPYTTEAAMATFAPRWRGPDGDFEQRLKDCEETVDQLSRDLKVLTVSLRRLGIATKEPAHRS